MRTWLTRRTRPITGTLAVAFVVALFANCATGEPMTEAQKACCAAMGHDCGAMAESEGCCSHESPRSAQFFATAKTTPSLAPALLAVPFAVWPVLPQDHSSAFVHLLATHLQPSRVPKYVLTSALLI